MTRSGSTDKPQELRFSAFEPKRDFFLNNGARVLGYMSRLCLDNFPILFLGTCIEAYLESQKQSRKNMNIEVPFHSI
jgi:hypothetical protein